ncbi:MATE family efflux transporter [Anaeromicropila herbilytica]|uniref:MATE family efflux transporter n=1 Tax=Anaeromicropila herbilytica TaxID=2785025 RepID=A0A7R7IDV2_9FIRM|nr:MATE family efflux transporter [Anaeromicropila herbilytica]BCN31459.1 MATE family efflux transporter [Anaeromicropila herbilytica]
MIKLLHRFREINRFSDIRKDKSFVSKSLAITVPVAMQGLLNNGLNLIDTLMVGRLGETSIAAVGLANKVYFVFALLLFGIVSGSGVLTAQYFGKRDTKNIRRVLGMALLLGVSASILFLIPALICPELIMAIFSTDKDVIRIGASYLCVICFSYPLTAITQSFVSSLRGVNQVKAPVVIGVVSMVTNIVLNYILIYGKFGAPELGVVGSATATLTARILECLTLLIIVYSRKGPVAAKIKELVDLPIAFVKHYFSTVTPVIANEFMWGLGVTMYSLVYGRMGEKAVAAITITQTVEQVLVVVFQSISAATAVILGNELGANHLKKAEGYAKNFIFLQFVFTFVVAILCYIIRWPIISIFNVDVTVAVFISKCFIAFILFMPFKMFNYVNIVGILRSGGDTKAALFLDCTGVWLIGIPMAVLGGLVFQFPIYIVYGMVMTEEVYKFFLGIIRYRKKIWLKNIVQSQ